LVCGDCGLSKKNGWWRMTAVYPHADSSLYEKLYYLLCFIPVGDPRRTQVYFLKNDWREIEFFFNRGGESESPE